MGKQTTVTQAADPLPALAMKIEMRPLSEIKPYPKNARKRTPAAIEKIAKSIQEFGWQQPIVVDVDGVIVIGHGRLEAAKFLKLESAPVLVATNLTPAQIKALRLADNRTHQESDWDLNILGAEMLDLKVIGVDLSTTGFEIDEIISGVFGEAKKKKAAEKAPKAGGYVEQYGVIVICRDEGHQQEIYEGLIAQGHNCKIVVT